MAELDRDNPFYDYVPANPPTETKATTGIMTDSSASRRWTKAGVVETDDGPVDVDARGKAADGSTPVPAIELATPPEKKVVEPVPAKLISTYVDPDTGDIIDVYDDGSEKIRKKGTLALDRERDRKDALEAKRLAGKSAYDILYAEFDRYGLGSLVKEVEQYIVDGLSEAEFTLKLRQSKPYQERFAANAKRIANGFKAIDEATYLGLEDAYQSIMQNYGLPASRYEKGNLGVQKGFEELIGGNVDPVTLEERIIEGQKVTKGNKAIIDTAKQFFPTLTDGDFLNYVLDPKNGLEEIKRKVTAVEIGAGAAEADLGVNLQRALELGAAGINKAQAKQGFAAIGTGLQRGSQLAAIYGEDPYTQTTAEEEVFGLAGKTKATREREKITGLEKATFGGQTGLSAGALVRDRAGAY